ncbi:hypothetical protein D3C75_794610 [compost metagenome]
MARDFSSSRRAPPKAASKPYLLSACLSPSVFMMSVCLPLPCTKGLMSMARPSGFLWTMRSSPYFLAVSSRKVIISLNFQLVSTCSRGKGILPG